MKSNSKSKKKNMTIKGRLIREPQLTKTRMYGTVCNLLVVPADEDGDTELLGVAAWGKMGRACFRKLHSQSQIYVTGEVKKNRWQDPETGINKTRKVITATEVFLPFDNARRSTTRLSAVPVHPPLAPNSWPDVNPATIDDENNRDESQSMPDDTQEQTDS